MANYPNFEVLDDVELTRDLPVAGLTAGWPGRIAYRDRVDDPFCVVAFFWGPQWRNSDIWSVPSDALAKRSMALHQLRTRQPSIPWLRDQ